MAQPDPGDPEPVEPWAVVVGVGAFLALCACVTGFVLGRRWAFLASLSAAVVLLMVLVVDPGDDRSAGEWFVQVMSPLAVGVVSVTGWIRTSPAVLAARDRDRTADKS